jgi:hypothetical protein
LDKLRVDVRGLDIVLEDCAHLGLSEGELAQTIAHIARDPTQGTPVGNGLRYLFEWRQFEVMYMTVLTENAVLAVITRIKQRDRAPHALTGVSKAGRRLIREVIEKKIKDILGGEGW